MAATPLLDALAVRIEDSRHNGALVLEGAALECPEVGDLLGTVGLAELPLEGGDATRAARSLTVSGAGSLFGIDGVAWRSSFAEEDGALTVSLDGAFPPEARLEVLGLSWLSLGDLTVSLETVGPTLPVPVVSAVFGATVELAGKSFPVTLSPAVGRADWLLRASDIRLPDAAALGVLLGVDGAETLLPPGLPDLSAASIGVACRFDPWEWKLFSLAATVEFPRRVWKIGPGLPKLRDVSLGFEVDFGDGSGGVQSVTGIARATAAMGELQLPVRVALDTGSWRVGVLGAHGFPSLGELVAEAADASTASLLPAGLRKLRLDTATLDLTIAREDGALRSVFVSVRLADHWPLLEDVLALEHVAVELLVDREAGDTSGFVTAVLRLGEVELPVAVRKPGGDAPWMLTLGTDAAPTLAGVSSLAGLAGGEDLAGHLPAGFADGALTLRDLSVAFDPADHTIASISLSLRSAGPWSPPGLTGFDARDLELDLRIERPGDSAKRAVTGSLAGTVDLAGAEIAVRASKPAGDAPWELEGSLAAGSTLALSNLAPRVLPPATLPAELPDLGLTTIVLRATPATGAFSLSARSAGPWALPLGAKGLEVGDLHLDLQRADEKTGVSGVVGGKLALAGASVAVDCAVGAEVELHGHVDSLRLSRLLDDLVGPGAAASLPLPAALRSFELSELDVRLQPARGRLLATAALTGFEAAGILLLEGEGGWGFALALAPAADWRLSSLSDALAVLDGLSFGKTVLVVSTAADASPLLDLPAVKARLGKTTPAIGHGLTFVADLELAGTGADRVLGMEHLQVRAVIGDKPSSVMLEAALGGHFPLAEGVELRDLGFRLTMGPAELEVGLDGWIDVVLDSSPLSFVGGVAVTPTGVACSVTMEGVWKEPFGAQGVEVSGLALELGMSFGGLPVVGIAGRTTIGDFHGEVAVLFNGAKPSESAVVIRFDSLKLADLLVSLCHEVFHDAIPPELVRTVFDISFYDVEIYVVPTRTAIGKQVFEPGTRLHARMVFWGLEADARVEVDYDSGMLVHGDVDPIELGDVLAIRGAGDHPKPSLHLEVSPDTIPKVDVEGEVSLLGLTEEVQLSLSDSGFFFEVEGRIFDLFMCSLEVRGGHLNDSNGIHVKAIMQNDLVKFLREHAVAGLREAARSAAADIAAAQADVRAAEAQLSGLDDQIDARRRQIDAEREETRRTMTTAQTAVAQARREAVADLDRQILQLAAQIAADRARDTKRLADAQHDVEAAQRDVDSLLAQITTMRAVIQGERDLAVRRMDAAQADVDAAQRNVNSIFADIRAKEAWWQRLPDIDWPSNYSKTRDAAWYYPMIGGMYTVYGAATAALTTAQGVLEGIKAGARFTPLEADPRIAGLAAAYGTATAALATATTVVQGLEGVINLPPIDADPRLVALRLSRETAQAALEVAVDALRVTQSGLDLLPVDLDPVIVGLVAAKGTAILGLKMAEGVLEATSMTVAGALEVSEFIVQYGLGGLFDVREASFEGALDVVHGGQVHLAADIELMGDPYHLELDFDFGNPVAVVEKLVADLLALAEA